MCGQNATSRFQGETEKDLGAAFIGFAAGAV